MSQGSSFSWGSAFGQLVGITFESAQAEMVDISGAGAELRSSDRNGVAVVRQKACLAIEPGGAQIKFIGGGGFSDDSVGTVNSLAISIDGFFGGGMAVLESFSVEAAVGELARGTASFKFIN